MKYIKWEITHSCNLRCSHCLVGDEIDNNKKDLSIHDVFRVINEAKECGVEYISLLGGEPLFRDDLLQIISYAVSKGVKVNIVTNGLLLSREILIDLYNCGLSQLTLSIDGPDEETYDAIRGKGQFNRLSSILDDVFSDDIKSKIPVININTVIEKNNSTKDKIEGFIKLFDKIPVNLWRILSLQNEGKAKINHNRRKLSGLEVFNFSIELERQIVDNKCLFKIDPQYMPPLFWALLHQSGINLPWSQLCCDAATDMLYIDGNGYFSGCDRLRSVNDLDMELYRKIHVNSMSVKEFIQSMTNQKLYKHVTDFFCQPSYSPCNRCQYFFQRLCEPCPLYNKEKTTEPYYLCSYAEKELIKMDVDISKKLPSPDIKIRRKNIEIKPSANIVIDKSYIPVMSVDIIKDIKKDGDVIIYHNKTKNDYCLSGIPALLFILVNGKNDIEKISTISCSLLRDLEYNDVLSNAMLWMQSFHEHGICLFK